MKNFACKLLSLFTLTLLCAAPAQAAVWPFKKKPTPVEKKAAPKSTQYQKFLKKKGLKSVSAYIKLYTDGKDVWLEVPDTLIGRKLVLSTVLSESSDPWVETGLTVSPGKVFTLGRTDSLLVLSTPVRLPHSQDSLDRSVLQGGVAPAICYAFPIMTRNADSSALVVKATRLLDPSNKDAIDLKGLLVGSSEGIISGSVKSELSLPSTPVSYGAAHVGIARELTFDATYGAVSARGNSFSISGNEKMPVTGKFTTTLSLVPDREIAIREADPRVGVIRQGYSDFSSDKGVRTRYDAVRWNIAEGDHITVYVDTLFPESRRRAIIKGVEAWNAGFRAAGLGNVVRAFPFPRGESFNAADPFICKVVSTGSNVGFMRSSRLGSSLTGGVLGATITIPQGYLPQLWREYAFTVSKADERFQTLFPSEDALCEVLTAAVMSRFGQVLGLGSNLAGSAAYSPAQLRDPVFTSTHGISASIMDNGVMFNLFAQEGDSKRGVPTVSKQIGPYDKFAIEWLYRVFPKGSDEKALLRRMVDSKEGLPEYLYLPEQGENVYTRDVRARSGDFGNDPLAEYNARLENLRFLVDNAGPWLEDSRLDQNFEGDKSLFFEWIWLGYLTATQNLSARFGGLVSNPIGSGLPKFTPIDKALQKEYMKTVVRGWQESDWMEKDRILMQNSGPIRSAVEYTNGMLNNVSCVTARLMHVFMAWKEAGSDYSPSEFLDDYEALLLRNAASGRLGPREDVGIINYIAILMNRSPELKSNYNRKANPLKALSGFDSEDEALMTPLTGIPTVYIEEMDVLAKRHLEKVRRILRSGVSRASKDEDKGNLEFLVKVLDMALDLPVK